MVALPSAAARERTERTFVVWMALGIAATIVIGFGQWALRGMVINPVPLLVHVHGVVFLGWLAILIAQTLLAQRNAIVRHKQLGRAAAIYAVLMIVVGTATAIESVRLGRVPPFFTPPIFLALSFMELASFAGLLTAALAMRRRSDWHRRLILGATVAIIGPAWGRILPMSLLGPIGGPVIMVLQLLYLAIGMGFDLKTRGRVHPAYGWAALVIVIEGFGVPLLAETPLFTGLAATLAPR